MPEAWESDPILIPASNGDELVSAAPNHDEIISPAQNNDEILIPADRSKASLYARAGRAFNPALRTSLGFMSGGFVGGVKGAMDALKMASEPTKSTRAADGMGDAFMAGLEGSSAGLLTRGRLPDIVLDSSHARWYEKLAAGAGQMLGDVPAMIGGFAAGAAAGIETGPGAAVTGSAGAFAMPTAIREALTNAYTLDQVNSSGEFLNRVGISIARTGKDAIVGGLTGGAGAYAGKFAAPLVGEAVTAGRIGATTGRVLTGAATMGAEGATMTVAPAALEGRLPEPEDFMNAAILMVGMKGAHFAAGKLRNVYARTGIEPLQVMADAKVEPSILEDIKPPEEATPETPQADLALEIPRAYEEHASAQAAADAFPGTKAEQVLDHPFADVPAEKLSHQLNMKYIEGPEDLKALQTRMAEVYKDEINTARGGTQTWTDTEAKAAQQVANMTGTDVEKVMAGRQAGDSASAVELKIRGDILMQATIEAGEAIKAVKDAGPNVTDAMKADALAAIHRVALVQADFTGASSEVGRALNYLKSIKELKAQGEGIGKLLDLYSGDPEKLLQMAGEINSPEGLARFARATNRATKWDMVMEGWRAGLLGPVTVIKKSLSDITIMASRPLVDTIAYGFNRLSGSAERMSAVEPLARIMGNVNGTMDGLIQAWEVLKSESMGGITENRSAIPGKIGEVIRTPYRAIEAVTTLFRAMEERGEAYAQAARRAAAEGFDPATREFSEKVAEYALRPKMATAVAMEEFGKRMTFSAPLGQKGQMFADTVRAFHAEPIFPFLKAPANVFKEQARLSPLAPLVGEWRADFNEGGITRSKAVAEMAVGYGLATLGMAWAASSRITGAGDPDANKNRMQRAAGWQPYSIKFGDTYYSIKMIHPVGTLLGMCADIHDMGADMNKEEQDKALKLLGKAFSHAVTEQTFLQGMVTMVKALNSPERGWNVFAQNLAASVVPSTVGQLAQMMDPYQREVDSIKDAVQNRIPGMRGDLQPQRDPFGEPIKNAERLGGISPITERQLSDDPVRTEAARLGIGVAKAPKAIQLPSGGIGGKLGKVELTPEQRDVFGDVSGHLAYRVMDQMVNSPSWADMPDMVKERAFKIAFERSNLAGKAAALSPEDRQKEIQRIVGEVSKRLAQK